MAESFLIHIATDVLRKISSFALQEISLTWGVKSELKQLESTLSTIQAVLLDAEDKQAKNRQLSDWLVKLRDVVHDADDVLDEFHYEALRRQVVKSEGTARKVCEFFSSSNPLAFRFIMGHKIKEIRKKLDDVSAEKSKFHLTEWVENKRAANRREMTHSFVRASDVIGRENDKENVIKLLMYQSDCENVSIIPIVGIGGLGKTTLAKLVFNDSKVKEHFQMKIWVCVSDEFDVTKLTKELCKCATGDNVGDYTIDQLQTCLRDALRDKRFLVILDDVWNENHGKWDDLRDLLLDGASGSKIVVTTRSPSIACVMGTVSAYNLEGLRDEDCLSLFVRWAFKKGEEKQYPNLINIGNEIVKKCRGVPLALRTLGSLLYSVTDERDWLFIKDNDIWKLEQKENDILPALRLGYEQLPSHLKHCFACCSLFPKDYEFNSIELIHMWMAQGLIRTSNEAHELEEIGERYVKELWSRSFFQDVVVREFYTEFKIHDLVHDLALLVAQNECSGINFCTKKIPKMVRHVSLCVNDASREEVPRLLFDLNKLRTIMFPVEDVGPTSNSFVKTCISRFKYMRVLDLRDSSFEVLPSSIGDLKHLRLLDLSINHYIKKLPNSICKLLNLQILRLDGCRALEELPKDIGNLVSLRTLYITTKQELLEIGCLTNLRHLEIVGCSNLKSLGEEGMERLIALRALWILGCESLESLPRGLKSLTALEVLLIAGCNSIKSMDWDEYKQGLCFSLRVLWIQRLPQLGALPQWLQLSAHTLQQLHIMDCWSLSTLPAWLQNLTSLQNIQIRACPGLKKLSEGMDRLIALKELEISNCPGLLRRCQPERGEDWPKIAHVPSIILNHKNITGNHI